MSDEKCDKIEHATEEEPSVQPSSTTGDSVEPPWNLDSGEDKNPFSEFSEEHLNKLDAVLSSVEVRELLQQSTPELGILNMDLEGSAAGSNPAGQVAAGGASLDSEPGQVTGVSGDGGSEQDDGESLPESVISVVFSDHGYAINPERAPKAKPVTAGTSLLPKSTPVTITMDTNEDDLNVMGVLTDEMQSKSEDTSLLDVDLTKPASPYSISSPRKSSRAPTRNRYLDDDWITSSPSRGRGRGRGVIPLAMDSPTFGLRASTRISDQKQRDLAEKILQANRQAMEAEKKGDSSSSPEAKAKGKGKKEEEETTPVGRGRGRKGKKGKAVGKDKSSQDESDADSDKVESDQSDKEDMDTADTADHVEDAVSDTDTGKKAKKQKQRKAGKYEQDSDYSDSDTVKTKGKKGKKKGKKGTGDEISDSDSNKKKGKVKGKNKKVTVDSESESGKVGKKGKAGADKEEDKDSDESGDESAAKKGQKKKIGLKGKKKLKLKNKKLNKKGEKDKDQGDSVDESVKKNEKIDDDDDSNKKSPKAKSPKKLTKKEKLKKLKEAKEAKKKALLAKKKEKLKAAKNKLKKGKVSDTETSDASPVKKKKLVKAGEKADGGSPGKKGKAEAGDTAESPGKKKKGKVVTKGGNKRKDESEEGSSPMKKAKIEKKAEGKNKRDFSDSEDDVPLKKIKTELKVDAAKAEVKPETKSTKKEQNIFSNLGLTAEKETDTKTSLSDDKAEEKSKSKDPVKTEGIKTSEKDSVKTEAKQGNKTSAKDSVKTEIKEETPVKVDNKKLESVKDKVTDKKSDKIDKDKSVKTDSKDNQKDSKDDNSHHRHHHHDRHRKHSHEHRDSVSSEKRRHSSDRKESDSRKDSHRRDSHDKSDHSHSRRDSKDRKDSHRRDSHDSRRESTDKDRKSSHSKDKRDKSKHDRRDSSSSKDKSHRRDSERSESGDKKSEKGKDRRDSVTNIVSSGDKTNTPSAKKAGSKDVKGKHKKAKKDDPVDSSMIDLFKPDNMPPPAKEETKEEPKPDVTEARESKVKFQDEKVESKVKFQDEKVESKAKVLDMKEETKAKIPDEKEERKAKVQDEKEVTEKADISNDKLEESAKKEEKSSVEKTEDLKDKTSSMEVEEVKEQVKIKDLEYEVNETKSDLVDIKQDEDSEQNDVDIESLDVDQNEKENNDKFELKAGETKVEKDIEETVEQENKDKADQETKDKVESESKIEPDTKTEPEKQIVAPVETPPKPKKGPIKSRLNISDFFTEKRLKINDPKPKKVMVKEVEKVIPVAPVEASSAEDEQADVQDGTVKRSRRNKAVAFAEILKKEKLGSDEEEEDDDEFEDDENDGDFEDPDKLYCICRQPHNQRFMICCDQCEEWFHGKCVGITRARGQQMEENNEEYVCPPCSQGKEEPDAEEDKGEVKERSSLFESLTEDGIAESISPEKNETSSSKDTDSSGATPAKTDISSAKDSKSPKQATPTSKQTTPTSKSSEEKKKKSPLGQIRKKSETDLTEKRKRVIKMFKEVDSPSKDKSSECPTKQTKEITKPVSILKVTSTKKPKNEKHIAVVERSTGKTLTGDKAPTESELKEWLAQHPTFEILKSHRKPETKSVSSSSDKKSESSKSVSKSGKDERSDSKSQKSHEGPEPVRLNVRKGLRDALAARVESADDMMLSNSEIKGLALSIEEELYRYFKDTEHKYKAKYRSLIFNIKDQKNKGLFRKILSGRIRPSKLVRMSADELASKELAQWREQEAKHTIEMIKQTEEELRKEQTQVTKKTHKGEVEVEGESGTDMSSLVEEPKKEQAPKTETKVDLLADLLPDTTDKHGQHLFDANCKICTGKLAPAVDSTPSKTTTVVKTEKTPKEKEKPEEDLTKQERDLQAEEVVKEVLKAIQRAKADAKKEELESQLMSSVTVRSPDSALSSGLDKKVKFTPSGPMLWKGFIYMQDVSKFVTTAYRVTGPDENLSMPDTITVCGRINPEHVWDYLNKVKQAASRDICVIRFIPGPSEEKAAYINLYSYLNSRSRCGVVENKAKNIKDFYIVPLASHSKIPDVLLPFDGPGLEENRCHMLLGVIIRNKSSSKKSSTSLDLPKSSHRHHRHHHSSSSASSTSSETKPLKSALKDPSSRKAKPEVGSNETTNDSEKTSTSSTPADKSSTSSTPATPSSTSTPGEKKKSISFDPIVKEYSHVSEHDDQDNSGDDPLGLNAPYDPEKETLKPKKAPKSDAVSLMIDKIAMSKNPAEATAAMVTALATTSKLGNQKKLLLELTKKVDEQKKLLEKKRQSSKPGESPKSSTGSPKDSSSPSGSKKKQRISSKDPRLQAKLKNEAAAAASSPAQEPMDVDMRVPPQDPSSSGTTLGSAPNDPRLRGPAAVSNISTAAGTGTGTTAIQGLQISSDNSAGTQADSSIPTDPKTPTRIIPTGFYIDHNHGLNTDKAEAATSADTKTVKIGQLAPKNPSNTATVKPVSGWSEVKQTDKSESVLGKLKETLVSFNLPKTDSEVGKDKKDAKDKQDTSKDTKAAKSESDRSKVNAGFDIVSHLQAEISGKSVMNKNEGNKASDKDSEAIGDNSEAGQAGVQLPTALRSLFTSLPPTAAGEEPAQAPEEKEPEPVPQDVDMRGPATSGPILPGFDGYGAGADKSDQVKGMEEKEKKTKSFMGFDYDSDSSDGSFDGFDDDGTKKLSPRKRKLVNKRKDTIGNLDSGENMQDVDLRSMPPPLIPGSAVPEDVDERLAPSSSEPPQLELEDVDHRRPPFPPQPGMQMPQFMGSSQPPPPGEEWEAPPMSGPPSYPPGMTPPGMDSWGSPGSGEMTQPPLPSEPPAPKPPEPPVKKSKSQDDKNKKNTDKNNANKNNLGPLSSEQRLKEIVLKIANNDPVEPPYRGPRGPRPIHHNAPMRHNAPMPYPGPPPMPPLPMPPIMPPVMPPDCPPNMPWPNPSTGIGSTGWMGGPAPPPLLNTQSPMMPPLLPPQLQPGVGPPPSLPNMIPPPNLPNMAPPPNHPNMAPPPNHPNMAQPPSLPNMVPPPASGQSGPPSLLNLPLPTPSMKPRPPSPQHANMGNNSPNMMGHPDDSPDHDSLPTDRHPYSPHSEQTPPSQSHSHHSRRSHDHERDSDYRRHDRYRDRSGDRDRDYDRGHRSRDRRDSRERDRGRGDRDNRRKDSDRDRGRHSKSNRY